MADNVQLKREELVGNDVVLENINPKTNTGSIINDPDGTDLNETINRIWNALNDKLSRIVNSVNGRTGAVVINSSDVGLGRVDNVSFADIQEWVLNRLRIEFENKRLHLYDNMDEVEAIVASNDAAYENTPFYAKRGWVSSPITAYPSYLSYMGYFYWDTVTDHLKIRYKAINVIGLTDNSILYNESNDEVYGKLRVNIWNDPSNALEIKNPDALNKTLSGLWVNPAKVNAAMYFYKGCYGVNGDITHPETDAFLDITNTAAASREVKFTIDGVEIGTLYYLNETGFKIGDIIVCQFSDENYRLGYNPLTGEYNLKTGISSLFVDAAPKIGQVTNIYDPNDLENHPRFEISFISIKPYVDLGLGYYIPDQMNNLDGTVLGVKTVTGRINDESIESNTNMSGINIIASIANNKKEYIKNEFNTVTPAGPTKTVYRTDINEIVDGETRKVSEVFDGVSSGVTIVPDMSMNVIPSKNFGKGDEGLLPNWPLKIAGEVNDNTDNQVAEKDITYLGINLDKSLRYKTSETVGSTTYSVSSGFYNDGKFYNNEDLEPEHEISPVIDTRYIDKLTGDVYVCISDNPASYSLYDKDYTAFIDITGNALNTSGLTILSPTDDSGNGTPGTYVPHTGGLAVNVGEFLEIGGYTSNRYYENGKINVLIDRSQGLTNFYNHIAVKIDQQSGLAFNEGGSLRNNTGLGMKISKYDSGATEGENDARFIAPSINDIEPDVVETIGEISTDNINFFGGMRYIHDDEYSTIGTRINDWEYVYNGEPIRHGSEGLRITDNNVLGVQPCKDSVVIVKHLEEYLEENFAWATILPLPTIIIDYSYWSGPEPDLRQAMADMYNSFDENKRYKLQQPERCYVVKSKTGKTRRYVYVGPPVDSGAPRIPTIDDYEPLFEFFATEEQFNLKYVPEYVQLSSRPSDWDTDWVRYYRKSGDYYVRVTDATAPTFVANEFYRKDAFDINGNPPNRDKIYVIGLYGEIRLMTWGPKRTLLLPDVNESPVTVSSGSSGSNIDIVSSVDASLTLIESSNLWDPNTPRMLNDEAELRADFNCDGKITAVDGSRILVYYADITKDDSYRSEFIQVKRKPRYWSKASFNPLDPDSYTYNSDPDYGEPEAFEMCYGRFYQGNDPVTYPNSEAVFWVRRKNTDNYEEIATAYATAFAADEIPDFENIDSENYDGKVYTKAYYSATAMDKLREWNRIQQPSVVEPKFTDELIEIQTIPLIDKMTNVIYDYESGVDVLYSKTRGLTKEATPDLYHSGYGLAINISDQTTLPDTADAITTSKYTNGALRFCSGGRLAVRINDTNNYDPNQGVGDDDLSSGTAGLCISNTNVLGIKILPDSLGGFTFDNDGNLVMTGYIAMHNAPNDWSTNWQNYYRFQLYVPTVTSDADLEYRRYHVITRDFVPITDVTCPDFVPDTFYTRFAQIGYDQSGY